MRTCTADELDEPSPSSHQVDLDLGRVIAGRYCIEGVLGRGGTSTVYDAIHTFTHRSVALKLLSRRHAENRESAERFLREARASTALVHRNAVEVLDMGEDDGGDVYLAMEKLDGETLFSVLQREQLLSPTRLAEIILPVLDALAAAHRLGIVHRDLKPENIMLARETDGSLRPVLLDFGIAKMLEAKRTTEAGIILGTPYYMSPEQIDGLEIGMSSDVWSMGVLLYECLTGELPFPQAGLPALFMAITRNDRRPLRSVIPAVTAGWERIIERAITVAPEKRFADAGELAAAIRAELENASSEPYERCDPTAITMAPPPASIAYQDTMPAHSLVRRARSVRRWPIAVGLAAAAAMSWAIIGMGEAPASGDAPASALAVGAASVTGDISASAEVPPLDAPSETMDVVAPQVVTTPASPSSTTARRSSAAAREPADGGRRPARRGTRLPRMETEW